jgi:hypothetical protein
MKTFTELLKEATPCAYCYCVHALALLDGKGGAK